MSTMSSEVKQHGSGVSLMVVTNSLQSFHLQNYETSNPPTRTGVRAGVYYALNGTHVKDLVTYYRKHWMKDLQSFYSHSLVMSSSWRSLAPTFSNKRNHQATTIYISSAAARSKLLKKWTLN